MGAETSPDPTFSHVHTLAAVNPSGAEPLASAFRILRCDACHLGG